MVLSVFAIVLIVTLNRCRVPITDNHGSITDCLVIIWTMTDHCRSWPYHWLQWSCHYQPLPNAVDHCLIIVCKVLSFYQPLPITADHGPIIVCNGLVTINHYLSPSIMVLSLFVKVLSLCQPSPIIIDNDPSTAYNDLVTINHYL